MFLLDQRQVWLASCLSGLDWLVHGFGTRHSAGWAANPAPAFLEQVHSRMVLDAGPRSGLIGTGDGLVSDAPGCRLEIRTADCFPVLMVDPVRRAVAAVHAGWRGAAAGVAARAVRIMAARFGTRAQDLLAVIGPGIGACCYQVGAEVRQRFRPLFPEWRDREEDTRLDLAEVNRRQLVAAGVSGSNIESAGMCTCCDAGQFFSWRRDQDTGRMVSMIGLRKGP